LSELRYSVRTCDPQTCSTTRHPIPRSSSFPRLMEKLPSAPERASCQQSQFGHASELTSSAAGIEEGAAVAGFAVEDHSAATHVPRTPLRSYDVLELR